MSDDAKKIAADILERMGQDHTADDARLQIAYREAGMFRRVLADDLNRPKPGEQQPRALLPNEPRP